MAEYNGHRSWNAWNVSLWFSNDENLYNHAVDLVKRVGTARAARILEQELYGQKTPDGARYNYSCIREALRGLV